MTISDGGPSSEPSPVVGTGTILGTVANPDGTPAPGAVVTLTQNGATTEKKMTDAAGSYTFASLAAGDYEVNASLASSKPSNPAKATVTAGATVTVDVKLQ